MEQEGLASRFIRYTSFDTMSDASVAGTCRPSTEGQEIFQRVLLEELRSMGFDVCYGREKVVSAVLKANTEAPAIAFLAHVDTASDVPGNGVKAILHKGYDGSDIILGDQILSTATDPGLGKYIGSDIITSDGTTLLGADDKAGVAVIMELASYLSLNPDVPHGEIEIFFTPDEETGEGMREFPYGMLNAEYCYTIDGEEEGKIEGECFNAASADIHIEGDTVHPGYARGKMHNALTAAAFIISSLPQAESPEATDGYYGYYYPSSMKGTPAAADVGITLRDFSFSELEKRIETVRLIASAAEAVYHVRTTVRTAIIYKNMAGADGSGNKAMELAAAAARRIALPLERDIIRGGTDGAHIAERGIPCPNIFTGGHNAHSLKEWVAVSAMENALRLLIAIVREASL